jgi:hypothetical protein
LSTELDDLKVGCESATRKRGQNLSTELDDLGAHRESTHPERAFLGKHMREWRWTIEEDPLEVEVVQQKGIRHNG